MKDNKIHIAVIGLGYVGLAQALLFNEHYDLIGYDINKALLQSLTDNSFSTTDQEVTEALARKNLRVTDSFSEAVSEANYVIIATPTNFNEVTGKFDLNSIIMTLEHLTKLSLTPFIIIKSTLSVGATRSLRQQFPHLKIFFSPEFLREGHALSDNYYPSRIIVGYDTKDGEEEQIAGEIVALYKNESRIKEVQTLMVGLEESEAIKLFANTYLALRVAFFNELDTFALTKDLDAKAITKGVSLDPRIGDFYNNPSFGYGGYCLPKDTKELQASFDFIPEHIISASVNANLTRKLFIARFISEKARKENLGQLGIFRLTMKKDAQNMRESSLIDVARELKELGHDLLIYEPLVEEDAIYGIPVTKDLLLFKQTSELIITNRFDNQLQDVRPKVFTRDLFGKD